MNVTSAFMPFSDQDSSLHDHGIAISLVFPDFRLSLFLHIIRSRQEPSLGLQCAVSAFAVTLTEGSKMPRTDGLPPELAAALGLITADEYLDHYGVPRRPWPAPKDSGGAYCRHCDRLFARADYYRRHMARHHPDIQLPMSKRSLGQKRRHAQKRAEESKSSLAPIQFALDRLFPP